jgi:hypothetical protein
MSSKAAEVLAEETHPSAHRATQKEVDLCCWVTLLEKGSVGVKDLHVPHLQYLGQDFIMQVGKEMMPG